MMTVHEVSRISGVTIRALHYYDKIGLLPATEISEAGYRLYDDTALERLQQILLFKALEFPLKDIKEILDDPFFDHQKALSQQIRLLELKKAHLQDLIDLARGIQIKGEGTMCFDVFDTTKIDAYAREAKENWGKTVAYQEYEKKAEGRSQNEEQHLAAAMMAIFSEFGKIKSGSPESEEARALVRKLQDFISRHYYTCTNEIMLSLGRMYAAGGEMTENIDRAGGKGTGDFVRQAIEAFLIKK